MEEPPADFAARLVSFQITPTCAGHAAMATRNGIGRRESRPPRDQAGTPNASIPDGTGWTLSTW
jgi:hypothetical protein